MTRSLPLAAILLLSPALVRAMPACPSAWFSPSPDPKAVWPDVWPDLEPVKNAASSDKPVKPVTPQVLYEVSRALYENCPRKEDNYALLQRAASRFLEATIGDSKYAAERQECYFWLGMAHALQAEHFARQEITWDEKPAHARSALLNFIELTDENLRSRAAEQVRALRLRSAQRLAFLANRVQVMAGNLDEPGWNGASQRVKCLLNTYPDTTGDKTVRKYLKDLNEQAHDFIHDYESVPRYDLAGMRILTAELEKAMASPAAPDNHWPTKEDIDPADPNDPHNCHLRPSPIPGPEKFDFDFSKKGKESRMIELKARQRKEFEENAQKNAAALLGTELP